jgi:glycosyltransferase involved in cell wall biosynthesis
VAVVRECLCEVRAARPSFSTLLVRGEQPRGPGYARNYLVSHTRSPYLAFQDADDVAASTRFATQLAAAREHPAAIVGSLVFRIPHDAQPRWTEWYNNLSEVQLMLQRFKEVTVINPTWFMDRRVFVAAGGR